jgi:hypothetical protein
VARKDDRTQTTREQATERPGMGGADDTDYGSDIGGVGAETRTIEGDQALVGGSALGGEEESTREGGARQTGTVGGTGRERVGQDSGSRGASYGGTSDASSARPRGQGAKRLERGGTNLGQEAAEDRGDLRGE